MGAGACVGAGAGAFVGGRADKAFVDNVAPRVDNVAPRVDNVAPAADAAAADLREKADFFGDAFCGDAVF